MTRMAVETGAWQELPVYAFVRFGVFAVQNFNAACGNSDGRKKRGSYDQKMGESDKR